MTHPSTNPWTFLHNKGAEIADCMQPKNKLKSFFLWPERLYRNLCKSWSFSFIRLRCKRFTASTLGHVTCKLYLRSNLPSLWLKVTFRCDSRLPAEGANELCWSRSRLMFQHTFYEPIYKLVSLHSTLSLMNRDFSCRQFSSSYLW